MLNIINILLSVCISHTNCNLVECVKNRKASKIIVENSHLKEAVLVKEIFLTEHLFVYHVLYFTKENRSKLHPTYSCSDDLYHLIKQTVKKALKTLEKNIINSHVQPPVGPTNYYTCYRTQFEKSIRSFQVRKEYTNGTSEKIKLYQYTANVVYINKSLFNVHPYGPGWEKDKKFRKQTTRGIPYPKGDNYRY